MLFWHVGFSIFIFRYVYKDYEADLRYLAGGALLPDFVDFLFNLNPSRPPEHENKNKLTVKIFNILLIILIFKVFITK